MTFVAVSLCLFGLEVEEFATIARSSFSAFRVLEGEFKWDEMQNVGRFPAALWVVLFSVVIGYIMLNMLLAIIMDTYMQVKGRVGHCETLWSQAQEIYRRYRQLKRGERVSLPHILKHLAPLLHSFGGIYDTKGSMNAVITKE